MLLREAVIAGDENEVARLLRGGVHHDEAQVSLVLATSRGRRRIVEMLLESGVDVSSMGTLLNHAVRREDPDLVRLLLASGAPLPNDLMHVAALHSRGVAMLETLLELRCPVDAVEDVGHDSGGSAVTPLHLAVRNGLHAVRFLLANGADARAVNLLGRTALHIAAGEPRCDVLAELLEAGIPINERDRRGLTPLHIAAESNTAPVVEYLISQGADVNALDRLGLTPLFRAGYNGCVEVAQALLSAGADPAAAAGGLDGTLEVGVCLGHFEFVTLLRNARR